MLDYGEAFKEQRETKGISQLELSKQIGTSHQNINRWESNKVLPNIDFCVQLADFYGISLDELVGRNYKTNGK
ncbi:MAG: helix-turn-helix domain-containing protein [Clostridia bacterium]|nr:helix-turn-helix domain-containing protein [Clostridia bacterium]